MATPLRADRPLGLEAHSLWAAAHELAQREGGAVDTAHLLAAMCSEHHATAEFLARHEARLGEGGWRRWAAEMSEPPGALERVLERAWRLARSDRSSQIEPTHLLGAMLRESRSIAYRALERAGTDVRGIRTGALGGPLPAPLNPRLERSGPGRLRGIDIAIHPELRAVQRAPRPPRPRCDQRRRARLEERSSPVHPALRDAMLRHTPADGIEAVERADVSPPEPAPIPPSLKDRFAELKEQARRRRRRPAAEIPQEKLPPVARRRRALASTDEVRSSEGAAPAAEPDEAIDAREGAVRAEVRQDAPESDEQQRALGEAERTTKALAERLFKKAPHPAAKPDALSEARRPPESAELTAIYELDAKLYPTLAKFGRNLTSQAARREIDPVIGRATEIEAALDILGKRRGNNPILLGEPGVGKTAIAEGLALRLVELAERGAEAGRRVLIELEIGRLIAGTHLRGALSERLHAIKDEVERADGRVIVFLDEIHAWLGAGSGGDGADAAGELKTALARGRFPCVGATTLDEFTKFVESDPAFERRFQPIHVEEPTPEIARQIALGVSAQYASHHKVTFEPEAVEAAVRLSHRYLHKRRLPDKAIGVLDLSGSRAARRGAARVGRRDVARVVAEMANLPPERLTRSDRARFLEIEEHLGRSIIGHDHVARSVAEVLQRNYAGFRGARPIGSLLFLGPTGVGKTEMVKALADFLFHDRDAVVRVDMSEYMDAHASSRLVGAPPGYVGHEQGGQLTEAIRRRPYQVVLLDEIEKAHPDILHLFLQLFDEGRLTDGRGRQVDFSNALVILTSNLGAEVFARYIAESGRGRIGFSSFEGAPPEAATQARLITQVQEAARTHFTPELWNRLDERLVFMPLREAEVAQIAVLQLEQSAARLEAECGVSLDFSDDVVAYLVQNGGFDQELGARPMRQMIARSVESAIAKLILGDSIERGDTVLIDVDADGALSFERAHAGAP